MNLPQTATVSSFLPSTVYTARDFTGYTLQHLKAMYPHSWKEAARHFGVALPELPKLTVEQIKQKAIAQQVWDFYPTPGAVIKKIIDVARIKPDHRVLERRTLFVRRSEGNGEALQGLLALAI